MTTEVLDGSLEEQWQRAIDAVPTVIKGHNPTLNPEQLKDKSQITEDILRELAESGALKLVSITGEDTHINRTIEPSWSESSGFGMPVDFFASLMGLDTPHLYEHGDLNDPNLLSQLANISNKPISAIDNGKYIEAVAPSAN